MYGKYKWSTILNSIFIFIIFAFFFPSVHKLSIKGWRNILEFLGHKRDRSRMSGLYFESFIFHFAMNPELVSSFVINLKNIISLLNFVSIFLRCCSISIYTIFFIFYFILLFVFVFCLLSFVFHFCRTSLLIYMNNCFFLNP